MEGRALPASSCPGRRRQRVPARRRERPSKSPRAAKAERLGSRRRQARTSFFIRSAHGGQRPCLPLHAAGAWRTSARHSEQSGQILRYGLPQIKKISVFCGQGPVDGAGVLWGRRGGTGKFPLSGGKSPMGWLREWRGKRSRNGEIPGSQDGKGRYWYPRTGRDAASGRGAKGACRVGPAPEGTMPEGEGLTVCAAPRLYGHRHVPGRRARLLLAIQDRALFVESLALMKRAGRGREFEGGGTFSRWQKVPPPSRKRHPLLRAGGIRASGH